MAVWEDYLYERTGTCVLQADPEAHVTFTALPCHHPVPWHDWRKLAGLAVCRWSTPCPECGDRILVVHGAAS